MIASALKFLEPPLHVADKIRVAFYKSFKPLSKILAGRKNIRLAVFATLHLLIALIFAYASPLLLIGWSVLILGAPHILMDIRHLVLKPRLNQRKIFYVVMIPILILAVAYGGIAATLAGTTIISLSSRGSPAIKFGLAIFCGVLSGLAWQHGPFSDLIFVYGHNVIGIIMWWLWTKRDNAWHIVPLTLFFTISIVLLALPLPDFFLKPGFGDGILNKMAAAKIAATLLPSLESHARASLLILFAFTQSSHYATWFYLIPEEDRAGQSPRGFIKSYRSLFTDCGPILIFATLVLTAVYIGWGIFDLAGARMGYLRFAGFHGYLEILVLVLFLTEGRAHASRHLV